MLRFVLHNANHKNGLQLKFLIFIISILKAQCCLQYNSSKLRQNFKFWQIRLKEKVKYLSDEIFYNFFKNENYCILFNIDLKKKNNQLILRKSYGILILARTFLSST